MATPPEYDALREWVAVAIAITAVLAIGHVLGASGKPFVALSLVLLIVWAMWNRARHDELSTGEAAETGIMGC